MSNNYNHLAKYIVQKYIDRITGNDIKDKLIGDDPSKRVMAGMLAENRIETSFSGKYTENSSTKFESVPSISVSFIVEKNLNGLLNLTPTGILFYSVEPSYSETVDFVLKKYSEKNKTEYSSIQQLCDECPEEKFPFPLTYKVVRIEELFKEGIDIQMDSLIEGRYHLEEKLKKYFTDLGCLISPEIAILQNTHITFSDLLTEDRFHVVCPRVENGATIPRWNIDIVCDIIENEDSWNISLQMVNKTVSAENRNLGYIPRIFNAGMRVRGNKHVRFVPIPLENFKSSFRPKPMVYAVPENTSVSYDSDTNEIKTDNVPKHYQYRLKTNDEYDQYLTFDKLIENPVQNLKTILTSIRRDLNERIDEVKAVSRELPKSAAEKLGDALDEYKQEVARFDLGIKQIEFKDFVKKAFIYMNKTFQTEIAGDARKIKGWRLFQIVFIVSLIPEMIRSEYKDDKELRPADFETANLLYFPTGGGKTEAFLGITVFDMFFDRLRGKNEGVSAIIKYPLRLLAVQQLDRVLSIIMKANLVKKQCPEIEHTTDFRVGFYVGKTNTPNKISSFEPLSERGKKESSQNKIVDADAETLDEYYRFIDTCPICGQKTVHIFFNKERWVLEHKCTNPECNAGVLPVFIVDNEIYRYLPSVIVSTIDKMALLGISSEFKMLFGQVRTYCPVHGFSPTSKCNVEGCRNSATQSVGLLKDPIPTLIIQDELHLVKESLGTFDSHYESFLNNYAKNLVHPSQRKQIRYIGATATISMYKEHIKHLYHMNGRRFPCEYPSLTQGKDFYSYTDADDITRIILGYAPYGRSITDGVWESVYLMRTVIYSMFNNMNAYSELCKLGFSGSFEDYNEMIYDYWIELVYNNVKQDAYEVHSALQNQGNNLLEEKGIPQFNIEQMTSDTDFQEVRRTLFDIQANKKNLESTNLLLATSTISHGVDEDAFNIMYFFGMPYNNAEYVQAYSRTGRKYTGIVIDIIRLMRVRDRSYLKNFLLFHENKDELIEPVPINRWAKNAIYSTLPGILAGIILQYYSLTFGSDNIYSAIKLKEHLTKGTIDIKDVVEKVIGAYECNEKERLSEAYKDIINEEVTKILTEIKNGNFVKSDMLSSAIARYSHGKHKPMTSLRDTEEQIEIEVKS